MTENKELPPEVANLYLLTATFTGEDDQGKKISLDIHNYAIVPNAIPESDVGRLFEQQIPLDKDDKLKYRKVKPGETFQFIGYRDEGQTYNKEELDVKEGDVFTYKRCSAQYIETFEPCPHHEDDGKGRGWLFEPLEIGPFPPPANPFFDTVEPTKEEGKDEPKV